LKIIVLSSLLYFTLQADSLLFSFALPLGVAFLGTGFLAIDFSWVLP